jgi:Cytidylate kinase-like family
VRHRVVCIASQDGAGTQEAAPLVAGQLGFRLIDEEIVSRAALDADVDPLVMADVERRKSVLERLLEGLGQAGMGMAYVPSPELTGAGQPRNDELRGLIRSAIEETASAGEAVIVAHAASHALGGREDVLRVLLTASPQTRARRLASALGVEEKEARGMVSRFDAGRADYLKRFYGVDEELPTHYDVVINTDKIEPKDAAKLIVEAAGGPA